MKKGQRLTDLIGEEKARRGVLVLAHTYQPPAVQAAADVTGDSFALARAAKGRPEKRVVMCGVHFMAETVKLLSPEKEVLLADARASCPMAEQIEPARVLAFKKENPGVPVVAYINGTAALKAVCDVCVTSSSAVRIVSSLREKVILFIPDQNLGAWVQSRLPEKHLILWDGCCPVHRALTAADVIKAKKAHPGALLAVHPECLPEVTRLADMVGSTAEIIAYALAAERGVIIGTERGVWDLLKQRHPEKELYLLAPRKLTCPDMKYTTPRALLGCVRGAGGEIIELDPAVMRGAARCVEKMLELGG